jgi:dTDP-4-amino-4,6-dideoxygalactose transaminase
MSDFIPFARPDVGEEEIAEVVDTLRSNWLTTGLKTRKFETEFADFLGGDVRALAVNSATAGLHLAVEAAGLGPGDDVITTPYTFTATAEVIRYVGAHPVFADIDPFTLCIDPVEIARVLTPRTKAIIPVHYGGLSCDMPAILELAQKHGLEIIEDAAHALPTTCKGTLIGCLDSTATVFSFYATKTLTTGEGGMLVTRDPHLAERAAVMRLHGINRDAFDRYSSTRPAWQYDVIAPGFKYNLTDVAAAIGIQQLKKAYRLHGRRTEMAARYDAAFSDVPLILPPKPRGSDLHAWHLYVIQLTKDAPVSRDEFIEEMAKRGVGCSVHYKPLHLHPYWRDTYELKPEDYPNALRAYRRSVSLPLYTSMTEAEQQRVIASVRGILASSVSRKRSLQVGA